MQGGGRINFINSAKKISPRANLASHHLSITRIITAQVEQEGLALYTTATRERGERMRKEEVSGFDQLLKNRSLITVAHF